MRSNDFLHAILWFLWHELYFWLISLVLVIFPNTYIPIIINMSWHMNLLYGLWLRHWCGSWWGFLLFIKIFLGKDYTVLIRYLSIFFQVYQKENYKTKTPEILFMILLTDTVVSKQLLRKLKIEIELRHRPLLPGKVL